MKLTALATSLFLILAIGSVYTASISGGDRMSNQLGDGNGIAISSLLDKGDKPDKDKSDKGPDRGREGTSGGPGTKGEGSGHHPEKPDPERPGSGKPSSTV